MHIISRLLLLVVIINSCTSGDQVVNDLLNNSISAHGGFGNYSNLKELNYRKTTYTVNTSNIITDTLVQNVRHPQFGITYLHYQSKGLDIEAYHDNNVFTLHRDGQLIEEGELIKQHRSMVDGVKFVFFQPFKLKDQGAQIRHQGVRELALPGGARKVHHLKVTYKGASDSWHFFLDTSNYQVVANAVKHDDKMSLITNDAMQWYKGLLVHQKRTSYLSNDDFILLRPQAFYDYEMINSPSYSKE